MQFGFSDIKGIDAEEIAQHIEVMGRNERFLYVRFSKAPFVELFYCFSLPLVAWYRTIIYVDKNAPEGGVSE
jgi:hypothetical protein